MKLLYANPISLALHYLLLFFDGKTLDSIHSMFIYGVKENDMADSKPAVENNPEEVYDFIIVGGGSAGSVVANRLSEDNYSVLLLEAGGHPFPLTAVPALAPLHLNNPYVDWCDVAVPQKLACQALTHKAPFINRGKALGGGSTLNYMLAMRGSPNDYNNWAHETNDTSWTYENLLPFFKKSENYHGFFPLDEKYHGSQGPLYVSPQPSFAPLLQEWLEAGKELGFPVKDPNGEQSESFFPFDTTTKHGFRFSTNQAYIYPAINRPNLEIKTFAHATKIEFDGDNRAVGIRYFRNNRHYYAVAKNEVIVSSGSIGSPQLLMLSGIGPEAELKPRGIPIRSNLPVGQNLQDHIMVYVGPFVVENGRGFSAPRDLNMDTLNEYVATGDGPFCTLGVLGGSIKSSSIAAPNWPDIYMKFFTMGITEHTIVGYQDAYGVRPGVLQKYFAQDLGKEGIFVAAVLGLTKTRGDVKLRSDSPFDKVDIDPKYFSDPDDMKIMLEGVKFALQIGETEAFRKIGARLTTSIFPGCEKFGNASNDAYWECYIRQWTHTVYHYTCTNRMGTANDPNAVVDSELRVIGTKNLRVVDASIMPKMPNTNTNLPTIMIGEKASDMIKRSWASK
ncbi:unnamed protein product [Allacma fusca]|uniref:Glucose-methanol-choline oxidoreductase N-terminal domain-containing protein n=1 Tax=Allacma fusca TaxID=39272 RepID=A0A8J2KFR6_9HEXA|nr:unnamed protein product [Allacma fusca]